LAAAGVLQDQQALSDNRVQTGLFFELSRAGLFRGFAWFDAAAGEGEVLSAVLAAVDHPEVIVADDDSGGSWFHSVCCFIGPFSRERSRV
jgi:hypothetical protein